MTTPTRTGTAAQIDASAGNGSTSATVPADCNAVVAFWSHWDNNGGSTLSGLTLNGVSFFPADSQLAEGATTNENGVGVATLMNPATGTQTVAWTWSAGGAREEGGELVLVFYKDANTSDPVRAAGTNAAATTGEAAVGLASTETTDAVVGFVENFYDGGTQPTITGVTAFINNTVVNLNSYDVGDTTGVSGTVTISNSSRDYTSTAAISLKESEGGEAFIAELSAPDFGIDPAALARFNAFLVELSAPAFTFAAQAVNQSIGFIATMTAPAFNFSAQAITRLNAFLVELSVPAFNFSAQALTQLVNYAAELTAPAFNFVAQAVTRLNAFSADLSAASFRFAAQALDVVSEGAAVVAGWITRARRRRR